VEGRNREDDGARRANSALVTLRIRSNASAARSDIGAFHITPMLLGIVQELVWVGSGGDHRVLVRAARAEVIIFSRVPDLRLALDALAGDLPTPR
jgi:hypothetical protein